MGFASRLGNGSDNSYSEYGNIINENFADLTNFTQTGSAFSTVGGVCNISSAPGSISFASYIRQTAYGKSDLELSEINADLTVGTINATSFGVGFGYYSQGTLAANSLTVAFLMDSTNKGKIAFYFNNSTTGGVVSASSLALASGDVTTIKIRQIRDKIIATWTNGTKVMTASYSYYANLNVLNPTLATQFPNSFNYTIWALGGSTHVVDNWTVDSNTIVNADLMKVGDSIVKGYNENINARPMDIIARNSKLTVAVIANPNVKIEELNPAEIILHSPKKIIISVGTNNKSADSDATIMAKLATLISGLTGYTVGTNLFIETLRPRTSQDVTGVNTLIRSTYPNGFIETYLPLWSGTSFTMNSAFVAQDGLHLNEYGAQLEADILMNYFGIETNSQTDYNNRSVQQNPNGHTGIGRGNTYAKYAADIFSDTGAQVRFGNTFSAISDGGGFLTALSTNNATFFGGLAYNGSNWTYKATSYSGLATFAGSLFFYGETGKTIGAAGAPVVVGEITPVGRLFIGPTATKIAVGGNLPFDNFADVSVGGAEADIYSATINANRLSTNGDKLEAKYGGNFVTGGTELTQLKVYFGGTAIWDSTGVAPTTGTTSWRVVVEIIRVSATVVRYTVSLNTTGASGFVYCTCGELTGLTLSNTNILKITGASSGVGSGAGDIVGKMSYIKFEPSGS